MKTRLRQSIFSLIIFCVPVMWIDRVLTSLPARNITHPYSIDTIKCRLSIDEFAIRPLKNTIFGHRKCFITHCPLRLTNNSNDTLKYLAMSASWWDIYTLDNESFELAADYWNVFKNGIIIRVVPPHQSSVTDIGIIADKVYYRGEQLRIGMSLQPADAYLSYINEPLMPKTVNVIWSNEITLK